MSDKNYKMIEAKKRRNKDNIFVVVGLLFILLSLFLAYGTRSGHFYEVMLLGLALLLWPMSKSVITLKVIWKMLIMFFFAGLFGDLLIGRLGFELWRYDLSWWGEILLYSFIYPFGGLVMAQSYVVLAKVLNRDYFSCPLKISKKYVLKNLLMSLVMPGSLLAIGILLTINQEMDAIFVIGCVIISLLTVIGVGVINYCLNMKQRLGFVDYLLSKPIVTCVAILSSTIINVLLHELPNLVANQWAYNPQIFGHIDIFGLPLTMFFGWIVLAVWPSLWIFVFRNFRAK
jgi:hypothetical protein